MACPMRPQTRKKAHAEQHPDDAEAAHDEAACLMAAVVDW